MRRWTLVTMVLTFLIALLSIGSPSAGAQDDLATVRQKAKTAAARVTDAQNKANKASADYFDAESKYGQIGQAVEQQQATLNSTQAAVQQVKDDLRGFLVDQYTAQTDQFTFFAMSDINKAMVQQSLTGVLANRKNTTIEDYRRAMADMTTAANQLNATLSQQKKQVDYLAGLRTQYNTQLTKLADEKAALDALLAKLEAQEAQRIRDELKAKEEEARRRAEEAARTTTTTRPKTVTPVAGPPNGGRVTVVNLAMCPVKGGAAYTDTYGQPRSGGRPHLGVDLSAPIGTPIVAPVDGVVAFGYDGAGGNNFTINGNDGNFYYGAHLSQQNRSVAGQVRAGTVIGAVGMTGDATVPHLHFEIHLGGRGNPINPYPSAARVC